MLFLCLRIQILSMQAYEEILISSLFIFQFITDDFFISFSIFSELLSTIILLVCKLLSSQILPKLSKMQISAKTQLYIKNDNNNRIKMTYFTEKYFLLLRCKMDYSSESYNSISIQYSFFQIGLYKYTVKNPIIWLHFSRSPHGNNNFLKTWLEYYY